MATDESGVRAVRRVSIIPLAMLIVAACGGQPASSSPLKAAAVSWSGQTWHVHSGTNGAGQCQTPSHVSFTGGMLVEKVSGGCGGGVSSRLNRHLGTWTVRFRMTTGGGKYAILLWPQSGNRPEVDFAEDKPTDTSRSLVTATYHPQPGCTGCVHAKLAGNFTAWHTATAVWTSAGWALGMDGKTWAVFHGSYAGNMHIAVQVAPWGSSGSSTLEVSKVTVS